MDYLPAKTRKSGTQSIGIHSYKATEPERTNLPLIKPTYQLQGNVHGIRVDLWEYIRYAGHKKGTRSREHHKPDLATSAVPRYGIFNTSTGNSHSRTGPFGIHYFPLRFTSSQHQVTVPTNRMEKKQANEKQSLYRLGQALRVPRG